MAKIGKTVYRNKLHRWFREGKRFKGRRVADELGQQSKYFPARWAPVKMVGYRRNWGLFDNGVMMLTPKSLQGRKGRAYMYEGKLLVKITEETIIELEEIPESEWDGMIAECRD